MPIAKVLPPVLLSLLLAACAADSGFKSSNVDTTGSYVYVPREPVQVQVGPSAPEAKKIEVPRQQAPRPAQAQAGQKIARTKKSEARNEAKSVLKESDGTGQEISLFIRKDDAQEEDLSSLLSADYLRQFDIPIVFNDAVHYFVRYFTTEKRKVMAAWLKRSRRYVPMFKEILREHGLPEDLIYLAMIESGFNPKAYSTMKACGPWQFINDTGGRYGLKVNHWVDERRDPEKSTVAAALYLKDLFNQFGNWYLAAAGYNAGEKRIERAVERHETSDFWELSRYDTLPKETREYIPRLLAAAIIAKEPERFGFTGISYDQPVRFVNEKVPGATPLAIVAKVASVEVSVIRSLNPELLTGITPPDADDYTIKLPESAKKTRFHDLLTAALEKEEKVQQVVAYTLKKRESLASVMKLHKVTYEELQMVNSCDQTLVAKQGATIYIPKFSDSRETTETDMTVADQEPAPGQKVAKRNSVPDRVAKATSVRDRNEDTKEVASKAAKDDDRPGFHIVRKGERLADISEKYGVDLATLREINKIKKNRIYPNMRIVLTSGHPKSADKLRPAVYRTAGKERSLATSTEGKRLTAAKRKTPSVRAEKRSRVSADGSGQRSQVKKKGKTVSAVKAKAKPGKSKRAARG